MADNGGVERGVVFGNRNALHVRWRGGKVFSVFIGDDEVKVVEHDEDVPDRDAAQQIADTILKQQKHLLFR